LYDDNNMASFTACGDICGLDTNNIPIIIDTDGVQITLIHEHYASDGEHLYTIRWDTQGDHKCLHKTYTSMTGAITKIISCKAIVIGSIIHLKINKNWVPFAQFSEVAEVYTQYETDVYLILNGGVLFKVSCKTGHFQPIIQNVRQVATFRIGFAIINSAGNAILFFKCSCVRRGCDGVNCPPFMRAVNGPIRQIFTFDTCEHDSIIIQKESGHLAICDPTFGGNLQAGNLQVCNRSYYCPVVYDEEYVANEEINRDAGFEDHQWGNIFASNVLIPNVISIAYHGGKHFLISEDGKLYCETYEMVGIPSMCRFLNTYESDSMYLLIYDISDELWLIGHDGYCRRAPIGGRFPKSSRND
jgi:hypothetical protein